MKLGNSVAVGCVAGVSLCAACAQIVAPHETLEPPSGPIVVNAGFSPVPRIPTSAPAGPASQPIDLTPCYGKASGTEGDAWFTHEDWKIVPKGLQTFDGILFDVSGTMLLRGTSLPQLKEAIRGIPIQRRCRYIHLLHGLGYSDNDGTTVAVMELHYPDGQQRDIPIVVGIHVRNWWKEPQEPVSEVFDLGSGVAWSGQGTYPAAPTSVRLFRSTFVNPRLNEPIDHIDFVSKNSRAILCIVSISVGYQRPVTVAKPAAP